MTEERRGRQPYIDPTVKRVGVSKLRAFNADTLRTMTDTFVVQDSDEPIAVLLRYDVFLAMVEALAQAKAEDLILAHSTEVQR